MSVPRKTAQRFDQVFLVRMIGEFFLALLIVAVLELAIRFGLVFYHFETEEVENTRQAAESLASNVRQIMTNSGGPVAARTVYPILRANHERVGLEIAITPTEVTTRSIEETFGFRPRGIAADWPSGRHHAYSIGIEADGFCIQCHIEAEPGDVLGHVEVRNYLSTHFTQWWEEVRLTGLMSLLKIVLHATVLFFLMRLRMEPLLSLRSIVSELAKGGANLRLRAEVKSRDEFGQLAADLNRFLDRLEHILDDLGAVITRISELNDRLTRLQKGMESTLGSITGQMNDISRLSGEAARGEPLLSPDWARSLDRLADVLRHLARKDDHAAELLETFESLLPELHRIAGRADSLTGLHRSADREIRELSDSFKELDRLVGEIGVLDEKMGHIAENGRKLVNRLHGSGGEGAKS